MSSGIDILMEMVQKFQVLSVTDRERYGHRVGAMVDEKMRVWLVPLLAHPPAPAQLEELKRALEAHARFEKFTADARDNADAGRRALSQFATWAVSQGEEEDDAGSPDE